MSTTLPESNSFTVPGDLLPESPDVQTEAGSVLIVCGTTDPTTMQWMRLVETAPGLAFWDRPEEDVYLPTDGEQLCEQ